MSYYFEQEVNTKDIAQKRRGNSTSLEEHDELQVPSSWNTSIFDDIDQKHFNFKKRKLYIK